MKKIIALSLLALSGAANANCWEVTPDREKMFYTCGGATTHDYIIRVGSEGTPMFVAYKMSDNGGYTPNVGSRAQYTTIRANGQRIKGSRFVGKNGSYAVFAETNGGNSFIINQLKKKDLVEFYIGNEDYELISATGFSNAYKLLNRSVAL